MVSPPKTACVTTLLQFTFFLGHPVESELYLVRSVIISRVTTYFSEHPGKLHNLNIGSYVASHSFFVGAIEFFFGGGQKKEFFLVSCLRYCGYREMIAVKMVFVRFLGVRSKAQIAGVCPQAPPWQRAWRS